MKITVHIKPNSKTEKIEKIDGTHFKVSVKAPAKEGKANIALIRFLARHFKIPQSSISILSGLTAKIKIVEIAD